MFCFTEVCYLVLWLEEDDKMYDCIFARNLVPPDGVDVLDLKAGNVCKAPFNRKHYLIKIIAKGE